MKPKTITFAPERRRPPFFMRWSQRFLVATAGLLGIEAINRLSGPNGNNVNLAAWMFCAGLVCFVLGALTGGRKNP